MVDPPADLIWIGENDIGSVAHFADANQHQGEPS
jgi:hypothetical protein